MTGIPKSKAYTKAAEAIEDLAVQGIDITCADDRTRRCYPIIAAIMADYPEQVLLTGVKKNRQCPTCLVPPDERGELTKTWRLRTHEYTRQRIKAQRKDPDLTKDPMAIHDLKNFAWRHHLVNVHAILTVDILHQLLKGIVMRLLTWIQDLIKDHVVPTATKRTRKGVARPKKSLEQSAADIKLDHRFRQVPDFVGLILFKEFSKVKQWTGNEQKAIVRQLMTVITPLLIKRVPAALHCARAIFDFVTLAQYTSHDEDTL